MPIGFWALSRDDTKSILEYYISVSHPKWHIEEKTIERLTSNITRRIPEILDRAVRQEVLNELNAFAEHEPH